MKPFVLVNTNVVKPPVSPVGLEYVGESLLQAGVPVTVVDLVFAEDWRQTLRKALSEPLAVGVSVRNLDDCSPVTRHSFIPWITEVVSYIRSLTEAPVILGGAGFSTCPEGTLRQVDADYGLAGDGEETAVMLLQRLERRENPDDIPGLVYRRDDGTVVSNPCRYSIPDTFPPPRRSLFDNLRYEREGAMVGVETKRGCPSGCIYCADPVARGRQLRLRPPKAVVAEVEDLVRRGVSWFHLCDSEFNLSVEHAYEFCQLLIEKKLGERVRWYCYCSPVPFSGELASLMKRAGCAGINFGVDSLDDGQLLRLGRKHRFGDVVSLVEIMHRKGFSFMFDLLLGAPGETVETMRNSLERVRRLDVPVVGVALGVRVYPGTALGKMALKGRLDEGLSEKSFDDLSKPVYYTSPALGPDPFGLLKELVGGDERFLCLAAPGEEAAYNYAGDDFLSWAIQNGARGAYWDILRRFRSHRGPSG